MTTGWVPNAEPAVAPAGWVVNTLLIVPYFMWLYRANQNCRGFSYIMRFKPKWAVGCHFVPPMNVFRPCQVMQEMVRIVRPDLARRSVTRPSLYAINLRAMVIHHHHEGGRLRGVTCDSLRRALS